MKVKKTIAGICALAMLGTCGMTAFAEEVTTTTTETPAETTEASATMTEGTTDTSVTTEVTTEETTTVETTETAVTEKNVIAKVGYHDSATYEIDGVTVTATIITNENERLILDISTDSDSMNFDVNTALQISQGSVTFDGQYNISTYLSVSGNEFTIKRYESIDSYNVVSYVYENGEFIKGDASGPTYTNRTYNVDGNIIKAELTDNEKDVYLKLSDGSNELEFIVNTADNVDKGSKELRDASNYVSLSGNVFTIKRYTLNDTVQYEYDKEHGGFLKVVPDEPVISVTEEELYNIFKDYVKNVLENWHTQLIVTDESVEKAIKSFEFNESTGVAYGSYYMMGSDTPVSGACKITKDGVIALTTPVAEDYFIEEVYQFTYNENSFLVTLTTPNYAANGDEDCLISIYNVTSGEAVATNLYHVKTGSTVFMDDLKPLNSYLTVGDYVTLMGVSYTYDKASNKFVPVKNNSNNNSSSSSSTASKKNPAGTGNSPKTGDNAVLPVALALTFVAGTAVVASVKRFKK